MENFPITTFYLGTLRGLRNYPAHTRCAKDVLLQLSEDPEAPFQFAANRLTLSLASPWFAQLFQGQLQKQDQRQPSCYELSGFRGSALLKVLEFVHLGSVTFKTEPDARRFVQTANTLGIQYFQVRHFHQVQKAQKVQHVQEVQHDKQIQNVQEVQHVQEQDQQVYHVKDAQPLVENAQLVQKDDLIEKSEDFQEIMEEETNELFKQISLTLSQEFEALDKLSSAQGEIPNSSNDSGFEEDRTAMSSALSSTFSLESPSPCSRSCPSVIGIGSNRRSRRTSQYKIRARALRRHGICGDYFQCQRCSYWSYQKHGIRRHQESRKH